VPKYFYLADDNALKARHERDDGDNLVAELSKYWQKIFVSTCKICTHVLYYGRGVESGC
jgi:hypothetical protein